VKRTLVLWLRALRVHQWAKNALILVPALAAHLHPSPALLLRLVAAFLAFSLLASALYLINDLLDREHDRAHPTNHARAIASGAVTSSQALVAAALLLSASVLLALSLPAAFLANWAAYLALSAAYSLVLKRLVVLDVMVLAALYTVRVVAGAAAVDVPLSRWFLAFSVFLFASLALLKRVVQVRTLAARTAPVVTGDAGMTTRPGRMGTQSASATRGSDQRLPGRGWEASDAPVLLAFGAATAVAAALVYCLYITGEDVLGLYAAPDLLWLGLPLLLYWIVRAWLLAFRGRVHDDPVLFALRDPASYLVLTLLALVVWSAS